MLMAGSLGWPQIMPSVFIHNNCDNFYGRLGYTSNQSRDNIASGYIDLVLGFTGINVVYQKTDNDDVIKHIVCEMINLIDKHKRQGINREEKEKLCYYKTLAECNHYIPIYKQLRKTKSGTINLRHYNFIDKILPEVEKIIQDPR